MTGLVLAAEDFILEHNMSQIFLRSYRRTGKLVSTAAIVALLAVTGGCKRDKAPVEPKADAAPSATDLSGTLVSRIPANAYGFFRWNGSHPAYEKLLQSPWAKSDVASLIEGAGKNAQDVLTMLKNVGLDPADGATWRKMFSEAVFFATPPQTDAAAAAAGAQQQPGGQAQLSFGVIFKADGVDVQQKLEAIREQLKASGQAPTDLQVDGGAGFRFEAKSADSGEVLPIFFVAKGNLGVAASDAQTARQTLASQASALPQVVTSEHFKKAFKGTPGEDSRFALGYFDFNKLMADAGAAQPNAPAVIGGIDKEEMGAVEAVSVTFAMDDAPRTDFRMVLDTADEKSSWVKNLAVSQSSGLISSLPEKPLLFLSFDGQSLRKIRDTASQGGQLPFASQLAFLDTVGRVGIAARVAPPGQSILPIPDVMVLFESSSAEESKGQIEQLINVAMAASPGMAGMQWTDQKLDDQTTVRSIMSPMGFGLFLGSKNNLVVLASSSAQIQSALGADDQGKFAQKLAPAANAVLTQQQNIGNVYVNFEQLASLLENMGGLLSMYAPQNQDMGSMLEPQKLQSLKDMGTMVGSITLEDGVLGVQSFYASPGGQVAAAGKSGRGNA